MPFTWEGPTAKPRHSKGRPLGGVALPESEGRRDMGRFTNQELTFDAEVFKVQNTQPDGFRLVLDLPQLAGREAALLLNLTRKALTVTVVWDKEGE